MLKLLESGLALLDPLHDDFLVHVDKDETHVLLPVPLVVLLLLLALTQFLLDRLLQLRLLVREVGDQLLNLVVALLERDFHDVDDFVSLKRRILTPKHL